MILTKALYQTEEEYVFFFTMNLLEACCNKPEVPQLVIRILINFIGSLVSDRKLAMTPEMRNYAKDKLSCLRAEVVFDFVKATQLQVNADYFLKLAKANIENQKFAEAAIIITKFRFYD